MAAAPHGDGGQMGLFDREMGLQGERWKSVRFFIECHCNLLVCTLKLRCHLFHVEFYPTKCVIFKCDLASLKALVEYHGLKSLWKPGSIVGRGGHQGIPTRNSWRLYWREIVSLNIYIYIHIFFKHTYHYEWQWGCVPFQDKTTWKHIIWWPIPPAPVHSTRPPLRLTWLVRCFATCLTAPRRLSSMVTSLGPIWFDSAVKCIAHRSRNGFLKNIHMLIPVTPYHISLLFCISAWHVVGLFLKQVTSFWMGR